MRKILMVLASLLAGPALAQKDALTVQPCCMEAAGGFAGRVGVGRLLFR